MADALAGKVARRLLPFLMLCYFFAYLDRVNVGFAALTMNRDIGLSATAYGFGAPSPEPSSPGARSGGSGRPRRGSATRAAPPPPISEAR